MSALSVVIPVYDEKATLLQGEMLESVPWSGLPRNPHRGGPVRVPTQGLCQGGSAWLPSLEGGIGYSD